MDNINIDYEAKTHKSLEKYFQAINRRHVRIKKHEKKNNNLILYTVLEELLQMMRNCDPLFNSMKPKLEYLGSYFDGLRVGQPTEYDINVILTMHMDYDKIILQPQKYAYASIKMPKEFRRLSKMPVTAMKGFKKTTYWCDSLYRLLVTRFRSWMQSVVDAALNQLPQQGNRRILTIKERSYKIASKTSGPANTISIHLDKDYAIDIDLVPTLQFGLPKIPIGSKVDFEKVQATNVFYYFAVPKPNDNNFSWRLAFPYQERFYTEQKYNLKSTLKLLKLFRDVQGFNKLASYFIKTLFLWEASEKEDVFWSKSSLAFLVMYMLGKLRDCLANRTIKNFWCPEHNLLEKIKSHTCQCWANRITHVINDLENNKFSNPSVVLKYFTKPGTISINKTV